MAFPRGEVDKLLAECHRRCCICHRFCGVKIETDHIQPREQGGADDIENAIPVCFECHAEIHGYNDKHPRGRKFRPGELRYHKKEWLRICHDQPDVLVAAPRSIDVGPLQALIDELEFNARVARRPSSDAQGCMFRDAQFQRAIQSGSVAILNEGVKNSMIDAYVAMGTANRQISSAWQQPKGSNSWANGVNEASKRIQETQPMIKEARAELMRFLVSEPEDAT